MRTEELELMAEVARGSSTAQRTVVGRLLPRVERLCRAVLRHREDAQDAAQSSLIEILASARNFRGDSSLERWSDRITVRTALRSARADRRARRFPVEPELPPAREAHGEASVLAWEYLDRLSEAQRIVLLLRHGLEFSIDDIADLIGISPNSVKDRLLRGRATIRKMLRRDGHPLPLGTREVEG